MCDAVDSSGASVCDAGWVDDLDDDFRDKEAQRWGGRDVTDGLIGKCLMTPHRHILNPFLQEARKQWFVCSYDYEGFRGASDDADDRSSNSRNERDHDSGSRNERPSGKKPEQKPEPESRNTIQVDGGKTEDGADVHIKHTYEGDNVTWFTEATFNGDSVEVRTGGIVHF